MFEELISGFAEALFWTLAGYAAIKITIARIAGVLAARKFYYEMPIGDREIMVKSILYILHSGDSPCTSGWVAHALDLNVYTADEALIRLREHGYVTAREPMGTIFQRLTRVELSEEGKNFFDEYYGRTGDIFNVAPWGVVVSKSEIINSHVATSKADLSSGQIHLPETPEKQAAPQTESTDGY